MAPRGLVVVLALAGCSQILGLTPPRVQRDAGTPSDGAPAAGFTLRVTTLAPRVTQGVNAPLDVAVARDGFDGDITVDIPAAPAGVTVTPATIAAGSNTGTLLLAGSADLTVGSDVMMDVVATGGSGHDDVTITAVVALHPGTLDPSFGSDGTGIASFLFGSNQDDFFTDAAFGPNGTIIPVGAEDGTGLVAMFARVTATGALDPTFGSAGTGVTAIASLGSASLTGQLLACVRLSSGNFVGVGQSNDPFGSAASAGWATAVEPGGVLDTEFDGGGHRFDPGAEESSAIVALPDGQLLIVSVGLGSAAPTIAGTSSNGDTDSSFHGDGTPLALPIRFSHFLNGNPAALAADGSGHGVYVGGGLNGSAGGAVLHVTAGGAIDATFAGSGAFDVGSAATDVTALAVQADGNLVIAGGPTYVARLSPAGVLDPAFGSGGLASLGGTTFGLILAVAIQSDGKILVAGSTNNGEMAVVRLLADGTPDPIYGTAGTAFISSFSLSELRIAPDGDAIGIGIDIAGEPLSAGLFRLAQ